MFQGRQKLRKFTAGSLPCQKGSHSESNKETIDSNANPQKEIKSTSKNYVATYKN